MKDATTVYNESSENMTNVEIADVENVSKEKESREELSKSKFEDIKAELGDIADEVLNSDLKSMMALDVLLTSGVIGAVLGIILGLIVPSHSDIISHYIGGMLIMIFVVTPFVALYKQKPAIVIKAMKVLKPLWSIYGISLLICMALPFGGLLVIFYACASFPFIGIISIAIIFGTSVSVWLNSFISLIFLLLTKFFPIPEKIANKIILVVDVISLIAFIAWPFISMLGVF